ncbi:MAG: hypothetical protein Q4D80_04565 [Pseudomonadota bacterium]|nr:hypothetical protein [Pseudomonadota bacterium]
MKNFALLSATALLLAACATNEVQYPGVSPSPVLNVSNSSGSFVGKKVNEFTREYNNIHYAVNASAQKLAQINQSIAENDSEYNAIINTIEVKLQAGTTPSNPDLVSALMKAQENLGTLESGTQKLAGISSEVIAEQEKLAALKSTVNATYAIPGAYDVDHADLNIISSALEQQENTNKDLIAAVKADIAGEQEKARQFRAEITRLNVDVAAGYVNAAPAALSVPENGTAEFKTIRPVKVYKSLAKDKSVRTTRKRVKLGKKIGVIEDIEPAKKTKAASKASPESVQHALKTTAPQQAKTVAEPVQQIAGTIFSVDFTDENVEYYSQLSSAVQKALRDNPDSRFEVIAIMPMDTAAQERVQNETAKIFGDMLTMSVPAENLQVSARSEISKKIPSIVIVKK